MWCLHSCTGQERLTVNNLSEVLSAVLDKRSQWKYIGLSLNITSGTLDAIERDCHYQSKDRLRDVLKEWLKQSEPQPTWDALQEALNSPLVVSGD